MFMRTMMMKPYIESLSLPKLLGKEQKKIINFSPIDLLYSDRKSKR